MDSRVRRGLFGHAHLDIHEKHYDPEGLLTVDDFMSAVPVLERLAVKVRKGVYRCAHIFGGFPVHSEVQYSDCIVAVGVFFIELRTTF